MNYHCELLRLPTKEIFLFDHTDTVKHRGHEYPNKKMLKRLYLTIKTFLIATNLGNVLNKENVTRNKLLFSSTRNDPGN